MSNHKPVYPFPEIVDPALEVGDKPWVVKEGRGAVNLPERKMFVPLAGTEYARCIRAHELAHIRWTPHLGAAEAVEKYKVRMDSLQCVEDLRMNTRLAACGVDMSPGFDDPSVTRAKAAAAMESKAIRESVLFAVASFGSGSIDHLSAEYSESPFGKHCLEIATRMKDTLWAFDHHNKADKHDMPQFEATILVARLLDEMLVIAEEAQKHGEKPKAVKGKDEDDEDGEDGGADGAEGEGFDPVGEALKEFDDAVGHGSMKKVRWGRLNIVRAPLVRSVSGWLGRMRRPADFGVIPTAIHRWATDRRIFTTVRRTRGGTVVIDASGSMRLRPAQIREILDAAPGCTVAIYGASAYEGTLKILADHGRVCQPDQMVSPGGANVIDGPVLRWMSKQQEPRLWVSDGEVTGLKDQTGALNILECKRLQRKFRIRRLDNTDESVAALNKLAHKRS